MTIVDLPTILGALPDDRRDAVAGFLAEEVAQCAKCQQPVTRTQPRELRKDDGICHLDCGNDTAVA